MGHVSGVGWVTWNLGRSAHAAGDEGQAGVLLEESLVLLREVGNQPGQQQALGGLGRVAQAQGDHERAVSLFRESLLLSRTLGGRWQSAHVLAGVAGVFGSYGQPVRAARLFGAAAALREAVGIPLPPVARPEYERDVAAARARLNETTWATAWAEGRAMTLEQAIAYALEEPG